MATAAHSLSPVPNYLPSGQPMPVVTTDGEFMYFNKALRLPDGQWRDIAVRILSVPQEPGAAATVVNPQNFTAVIAQSHRVREIYNAVLRALVGKYSVPAQNVAVVYEKAGHAERCGGTSVNDPIGTLRAKAGQYEFGNQGEEFRDLASDPILNDNEKDLTALSLGQDHTVIDAMRELFDLFIQSSQHHGRFPKIPNDPYRPGTYSDPNLTPPPATNPANHTNTSIPGSTPQTSSAPDLSHINTASASSSSSSSSSSMPVHNHVNPASSRNTATHSSSSIPASKRQTLFVDDLSDINTASAPSSSSSSLSSTTSTSSPAHSSTSPSQSTQSVSTFSTSSFGSTSSPSSSSLFANSTSPLLNSSTSSSPSSQTAAAFSTSSFGSTSSPSSSTLFSSSTSPLVNSSINLNPSTQTVGTFSTPSFSSMSSSSSSSLFSSSASPLLNSSTSLYPSSQTVGTFSTSSFGSTSSPSSSSLFSSSTSPFSSSSLTPSRLQQTNPQFSTFQTSGSMSSSASTRLPSYRPVNPHPHSTTQNFSSMSASNSSPSAASSSLEILLRPRPPSPDLGLANRVSHASKTSSIKTKVRTAYTKGMGYPKLLEIFNQFRPTVSNSFLNDVRYQQLMDQIDPTLLPDHPIARAHRAIGELLDNPMSTSKDAQDMKEWLIELYLEASKVMKRETGMNDVDSKALTAEYVVALLAMAKGKNADPLAESLLFP